MSVLFTAKAGEAEIVLRQKVWKMVLWPLQTLPGADK